MLFNLQYQQIFMFSKIWQTISSWMGIKSQKPLTRVKKPIRKERFLIIDDPFEKKIPQKKQIKQTLKPSHQVPRNSQQLMNFYKLSLDQEQKTQIQQQTRIDDNFIIDLTKINKTLKGIQEKYHSVSSNSAQISQNIETILGGIQKANKSQYQQAYVYKKYIKYVESVVEIKYSGEKIDYPQIQYQSFKKVNEVWQKSDDQSIVPGYDYLRFIHLRLLAPTRWLNDQVISQYINLMSAKLSEKQNNSYFIFNSLKVTSLFDKNDYKKLEKVLQRQKITKNSKLILAIHKVNHWLFIKMQESMISIYDSLTSQNLQNYINFSLINKIIKFAQHYYGTLPQIQRVVNFPQQKNGNDCGMMMLCGIKDVIRQYRNWSFSQNDMWYKRVLVTKELLEKKLTGF